jgi:hypothetical protein
VFAQDRRACCDWYNTYNLPPYDVIVLDSGSVLSMEYIYKNFGLQRYAVLAKNIYEKYLDSNTDLEGTVVTKFTITHEGCVINDTILSSTTGNKEFDKEIREVLYKWIWDEETDKELKGRHALKRKLYGPKGDNKLPPMKAEEGCVVNDKKINNKATTITLPFTFWKSEVDRQNAKWGLLERDTISESGKAYKAFEDSCEVRNLKFLNDSISKEKCLKLLLRADSIRVATENAIREQSGQND